MPLGLASVCLQLACLHKVALVAVDSKRNILFNLVLSKF